MRACHARDSDSNSDLGVALFQVGISSKSRIWNRGTGYQSLSPGKNDGLRFLLLPEDLSPLEDIAEHYPQRYDQETGDETCCIQEHTPVFVVLYGTFRR